MKIKDFLSASNVAIDVRLLCFDMTAEEIVGYVPLR